MYLSIHIIVYLLICLLLLCLLIIYLFSTRATPCDISLHTTYVYGTILMQRRNVANRPIARALNCDTRNKFLPLPRQYGPESQSNNEGHLLRIRETLHATNIYPTYFLWSVTFRFVPGKRVQRTVPLNHRHGPPETIRRHLAREKREREALIV